MYSVGPTDKAYDRTLLWKDILRGLLHYCIFPSLVRTGFSSIDITLWKKVSVMNIIALGTVNVIFQA